MKSLSYAISVAAEKRKVYIAMLFIHCVYAGMALFSKAAISKGMNPFVFVVYRQAFAFLALAPFAFFFESSKEVPLSYTLLIKIFFISLFGITLSLNLYYVAINYTSATFAAATTTAIPAITFVMAVLLRMESISIKKMHGLAKVLGSVSSLSGALVYALIKGPPLKFMNWFPENLDHQIHPQSSSKGEWIKGSLIMLSANTAWSMWLILQGPIVKEYPAKLRLTALQCFFSCMQSAFWTIAIERRPSAWKIGWDIHLLAVVYCGVIVTGITYWLQVWVIEKKGSVFTAMFTPLALIITAIFSAIMWKEAIYWGSIGGGLLLVAGLYSVLWGKEKENQEIRDNDQKQEHKEEVLLV
ncbi:PREDICTED: WAT1-related protein At1g43650 [Fragaria vesca subsp. vesca]|uniref:WAT1-related protein At1g43650 n=1 Tax=Fragaria vesca subsp. vesca TaxID=101020 RepID=UPI0002C3416D|nr:PREDICTED: WAT1-related protein At1g43650 [Fragaria vesca subsp. vesca]